MDNPRMVSLEDFNMLAGPSINVAVCASVNPVPFKQVSCASGSLSTAELDPFCGKMRVRTGVMLLMFSAADSARAVPLVLNEATRVSELLFGSVG